MNTTTQTGISLQRRPDVKMTCSFEKEFPGCIFVDENGAKMRLLDRTILTSNERRIMDAFDAQAISRVNFDSVHLANSSLQSAFNTVSHLVNDYGITPAVNYEIPRAYKSELSSVEVKYLIDAVMKAKVNLVNAWDNHSGARYPGYAAHAYQKPKEIFYQGINGSWSDEQGTTRFLDTAALFNRFEFLDVSARSTYDDKHFDSASTFEAAALRPDYESELFENYELGVMKSASDPKLQEIINAEMQERIWRIYEDNYGNQFASSVVLDAESCDVGIDPSVYTLVGVSIAGRAYFGDPAMVGIEFTQPYYKDKEKPSPQPTFTPAKEVINEIDWDGFIEALMKRIGHSNKEPHKIRHALAEFIQQREIAIDETLPPSSRG